MVFIFLFTNFLLFLNSTEKTYTLYQIDTIDTKILYIFDLNIH